MKNEDSRAARRNHARTRRQALRRSERVKLKRRMHNPRSRLGRWSMEFSAGSPTISDFMRLIAARRI